MAWRNLWSICTMQWATKYRLYYRLYQNVEVFHPDTAKHLNILENAKFPFWGENNMPGCFEINIYSQTSVFRNTCLKRNLHNQTTYLNYIQSQHVQFLKYLSEQSKTVAHLNDVRYSRDIHTMPFKNNYYKLDYYHLTVTSYWNKIYNWKMNIPFSSNCPHVTACPVKLISFCSVSLFISFIMCN